MMGRAGFGHKIYYGWIVLAALTIVVLSTAGVRFATGPFLKPMTTDLGVGRGPISVVLSVSLLLYGFLMPLVGRLMDRYGPRPVMVCTSLILVASLTGTALATEFWQVALFYGVLAAGGFAGTSQVGATMVAANWFTRRRGTATSLVNSAAMAAMALFTPLVTYLILRVGWRHAFLLLTIPFLVMVIPLALWVIKRRPEDMGLMPDGDPPVANGAPTNSATPAGTGDEDRIPLVAAMRTRTFWSLAGGFFTCGYSMNLLITHGQPMLTDHGFSDMIASTAVGLLGTVSIFGAVGIGILSDRIGRKRLLALVYATRAVGFILFLVVRQPVYLYLLAATAGVFWSGSASMTSSLTADLYGRASVGTLFGSIFVFHQVGSAISGVVAGFFFDLTGTYTVPFLITAALLVAGALAALSVDERHPMTLPVRPAVRG